jgi:acyl-CoA synthetase (AMP-forming)/AMP-acid ligase II
MAESIVVAGFNLADLFERVADAVPERTAVVAGATRRTYAELDERATRIAHALAADVEPGAHVGLCLRNSIAHVELMLGCYKVRAVPVNVNWRYTDAELEYIAADADLVQLWRDTDVSPERFEAFVATGSPARDFGERSGDDRYVLYTGGTTGHPKGVVWRQEDIFFGALGGGNPGGPPITEPAEIVASVVDNPAQRLRAFLPPGDSGPDQYVALALGPLVHASGQWSALGTLLGGGKLVLYTDAHVDMARVLALIEIERVNSLNLVGDASARPLVAALRAEPDPYDVSSLRLLGSGGSMLSADVKIELLRLLPNVLGIVEGIGSSESPAQAVSVTTRDAAAATSLTFAAKAETMVVDDDLHPIPPGSGTVGRLATRGRVPLGYYKDPDRSASTFVEIDGARWSLPGDMATIDTDGTVHLLGRGSQCINTGGEKVFPEEVEAVLKRAPQVADAVVLGAPDERYGQRVVAIVAPADRGNGDDAPALTLTTLQDHCRAHLAGYKLPRALHLVDAVARTDAGKVDYTWARAVLASAPEP